MDRTSQRGPEKLWYFEIINNLRVVGKPDRLDDR